MKIDAGLPSRSPQSDRKVTLAEVAEPDDGSYNSTYCAVAPPTSTLLRIGRQRYLPDVIAKIRKLRAFTSVKDAASQTPGWRATRATDAPASSVSSTIRRFSAMLRRCRCPATEPSLHAACASTRFSARQLYLKLTQCS